jgi:hypothetical protein
MKKDIPIIDENKPNSINAENIIIEKENDK